MVGAEAGAGQGVPGYALPGPPWQISWSWGTCGPGGLECFTPWSPWWGELVWACDGRAVPELATLVKGLPR